MDRQIYCLGISTSPRHGGNTEVLLEKAIEGAAATGAKTEIISLNNYKFSACMGCNSCFTNGECVVRDDMQIIYEKLLAADRIILAAPIFSMGMCAQAKAMIDRTQRFWSTKYILKKDVIADKDLRPKREGILLSVAGSNHKNVFDGAIQVTKYFFLMLEAKFVGSYCYPQVDDKGDILKHPDYLTEVYNAGLKLASD